MISGIGAQFFHYVLITQLGPEIVLGYFWQIHGASEFMFHWDFFRIHFFFYKNDSIESQIGLALNLFIWALALVIFLCRKKIIRIHSENAAMG